MTEPEKPTTGDLTVFGQSAVDMREQLVANRAEIARTSLRIQQELDAKKQQLDDERKALEARFRSELARMEEQMAPMRKQLAQMTEMMWTVDLYLGRDEEIELLIDGEPAPQDTPITLRQMVLAMDEESLIHVEQGGLTGHHRDVQAFLDWMLADWSHVETIIPESKSVVVMQPTKRRRDYGDPWANEARRKQDETSYWFLRNGKRLYRMTTDIVVGDRIVPTRSEFLDYFYEKDTWTRERKPMEPGSEAWLKAEEAADAKQRHYMRLMLIIQGLIDRTVAFHPLPAIPPNMMSVQAQNDGKVVIINELDNVLESGREPFREWQKRLNGQLRPGMRVIGEFSSTGFGELAYSSRYDNRYGHPRLWPESARYPQSYVPHLIERRKSGGGLVFLYERTGDTVYDSRGYAHDPEKRASCTVQVGDGFILPFDLVEVEEMQVYLNSRIERQNYLEMVPVLRAAIAAKQEEREAEEPFYDLVAGVLLRDHGGDINEIQEAIPGLVTHWKIANRWARPLVSPNPAEQAAALAAISKEWGSRLKAAQGKPELDRKVVEAAKRVARDDLLAVGRKRDGSYVAYAASEPYQRVWMDEYSWTKGGKYSGVKRWTIPLGRTLASLVMLHEAEAWTDWNLRASRSDHISGPESAQFAERYLFPAAKGEPMALLRYPDHSTTATGVFELLYWIEDADITDPHYGRKDEDRKIGSVWSRWKRGVSGQIEVVGWDATDRWEYQKSRWVDVPATEVQYKSRVSINVNVDYDPQSPFRHSTRDRMRPAVTPEMASLSSRAKSEVMVWEDPAMWARYDALRDEIRDEQNVARSEQDAWNRRVSRYIDALDKTAKETELAAIKKRFVEDYGTTDEELWQNHLKSLRRKEHTPSHELFGELSRFMAQGGDPVGKTVRELFPDHRRWDHDERYADIVIEAVPEPEESEEDE